MGRPLGPAREDSRSLLGTFVGGLALRRGAVGAEARARAAVGRVPRRHRRRRRTDGCARGPRLTSRVWTVPAPQRTGGPSHAGVVWKTGSLVTFDFMLSDTASELARGALHALRAPAAPPISFLFFCPPIGRVRGRRVSDGRGGRGGGAAPAIAVSTPTLVIAIRIAAIIILMPLSLSSLLRQGHDALVRARRRAAAAAAARLPRHPLRRRRPF